MRNKFSKLLTGEYPPHGNKGIFAKTWKYAACMLLAFILGIGQMWAEDFTISNICTGSYLSPGNIVKVTLASNTSASSGRLDTKSSKTGGFTILSNAPGVYVKSFTFTDSQYSGNKKGTITCENGGTLVVDANGKYTITANTNATSVEIKVVASSSGDCKITGLSVIATNGTANNIETLSGFSFSSGTFSFTSKVNGSSVTPTVGLTSQSSSSWSASSSNISAPSSNDSKTITVSAISGYHLKYVAFYDSNCRLSLVEKSSTGGTVNGASWTAADDKTTAVTFKNGISTSITITNVFVVTEADATATKHTVTYDLNGGAGTTPIQADVAEGAKFTLHNGTTDITAPAGKKFDGWHDGTTKYAGGAEYTMGGDDVELTAQWADAYAVTYVPNNGVLPAETMTDSNSPYLKDAEVTLLANAFTAPDGKEFDAWVVTETVSGDAVTVTDGKFTMPAVAVTVTATWKDACALAPTVSATTLGTTSYTTQVVNCAGISVLGSAGCTISEYGFVYGTTTAPTISDNKKALTGDYTVINTAFAETTLTGLAANTKYYVRAYATNSFGTAYGDESSFTTLTPLGNVLVVVKNAGQTSDAITALRDNGFLVTVSTPNDSRDYTGIDLVVLDESLDGSLAQTSTSEASTIKGANIPILNLKAFFYTKTNRWNWGTPVNGTATNEIANISAAYCNAESHPIFTGLTIGAGGAIDLIDPAVASGNTLQGVTTNTLVEGKEGYTLATSGDGITFVHELTPAQRGVTDAKYLMVAISNNAKDNLSADGEKLIVNAAKYLIGSATWTPVLAPATTGVVATPAASYSEGDNISLSITATNVDAATTYTWYKGATLAAAEEAGAIQAAKTIAANGNVYAKANCEVGDAGTYWCVITKSAGCEISASLEVTVLTCTKPGTPANLTATDIAYTTATLGWDAAENANGYKISIVKKSDESVVLDWTTCATNSYAAIGLTQGTGYTFKVKAVGATGYCEYGLEASKDFTTTAPSVADLVTIADDWTYTPSASIAGGTLAEDNKLFAEGDGCDYSDGMRVKENRALAFKVVNGAKVKVTFGTNGSREMQLGTAASDDDNKAYGHSATSPAVFDVTADGVVYLTASSDLRFSKLEIMYPHTVTYKLNGGTGTLPTQEAKYVGETFTAHDGTTDITAPTGKEFQKWVDQDAADVLGGATYTMPAKAVTLTAQWQNETAKYSITYDLNGYSAEAPTETSKPEGAVITIKAAPARDGYHFLGWLCNIDDATYQAGDPYTMAAAPTTFTAQWQQYYIVTYKDGDNVLDTEEVNAGSHPAGIANPTKELKSFLGWTLLGEDDLVDPTSLSVATTLYAKWADFDGCAWLAVDREATAKLSVGDNITLTTASFGGSVKVANINSTSGDGTIRYHANGLYLSGGGKDSLRVTIDHQIQEGTKITLAMRCTGAGARGMKLLTLNGTNIASLGWADGVADEEKTFTYEVPENSPLIGQKAFRLQRNNTIYLQYVTVEDCAPQDYVVTYKDGETTLGTEDVFENGHPTAAGVNTRKNGYVFNGWAETADGAVVELSAITITAAKTLYAKYSERVCPTSGKIFSLNMDKTVSTEVNVKSSSINLDGYATISGGVATLANTSNDTRAKVTTTPSIRFSDGNQGYLQVDLDCPISEGDIIRYVNTSSGKIAVRTAHGTSANETILEGNKSEITTVEVNAALDGLYTIFVERKDNTSDLKYFEIYRRPALTGVSLADLTVREGASATPIMTLSPSNDAAVTSQAWSIVSGDDKISINPTTGEVTGVAEGDAVVKVILNGDAEHFSATANVHVVETFTQINVDESTVWDFSKAGEVSSAFSEQILANVDGVTLDATQFNARQLVGTAQNITTTYFQGTMLSFNADIAGLLTVKFTNGNSNIRKLRVYDNDDNILAEWEYSNASTQTKSIEVPAGKVTLRSFQGDAPNNVRIMKMEFFALAYTREVAPGELGTICYPEGLVAVGADLYQMAGVDENKKFVFDEVTVPQPGVPYLFEAQANVQKFYATTATAADAAGTSNGMVGTFSQIIIPQSTPNTYYFSGRKFYAVTARATDLTVPANRAYVDLSTPHPAGAPKHGVRRISFGVEGANTATGVDEVQGDKVQSTKVLINGQLFILRGEKMYDATGQLVK